MNLPEDKLPIRVIYEYEGEKYEITGEALENYIDNISDAGMLAFTGRISYRLVKWVKCKE